MHKVDKTFKFDLTSLEKVAKFCQETCMYAESSMHLHQTASHLRHKKYFHSTIYVLKPKIMIIKKISIYSIEHVKLSYISRYEKYMDSNIAIDIDMMGEKLSLYVCYI